MATTKNCQFCGESMPRNAYYCKGCNQTQRNRKLAFENYLRIQSNRYGVIILSLLPAFASLLYYFDQFGLGIVLIIAVTYMGASLWWGAVLLSFLMQLLPSHLWSGIKIPYYLERIEYCKNRMKRNMVVFPLLGLLLIFGQYELSQNRPSLKQFRNYIKKETSFSTKHIIEQHEFPIMTFHKVRKGEDLALFVGIYGGFHSIDAELLWELFNS